MYREISPAQQRLRKQSDICKITLYMPADEFRELVEDYEVFQSHPKIIRAIGKPNLSLIEDISEIERTPELAQVFMKRYQETSKNPSDIPGEGYFLAHAIYNRRLLYGLEENSSEENREAA